MHGSVANLARYYIMSVFDKKKSEVSQDALRVVHNDNIFNYCILKALDVRFQMILPMST